jgi:co-chaperonin GroES (HSP10)
MKQLLGKRILITTKDPAVTDSGIILESAATEHKQRPFEGTVDYVGDKVEDIQVGDHIHFNSIAGKEFPHDGKTYLLIHEQDVNGIYLS